jgi:17beta-estradiol 17-dehydrogenase / very-long-chain 3-oxoacyl-CoA reductase
MQRIFGGIRWMLWGKRLPRKFVFGCGLYTIGYTVYDALDAPIRHQIQEPVDMASRYGRGTVAVIAGPTDAAGLAYCDRLQKEGFKLIFVVQQEDAASRSLTNNFSGSKTIAFDFATSYSHKDYEKLCKEIQGLADGMKSEISVLVNNVQRLDARKGKIYKASDEEIIQTINMNTCPAVFMTRFLGPQMKARQQKSAIINMGSIFSQGGHPGLPLFSAGKAFTDYFSQVVGFENPDLDILTVHAQPVKSQRHPDGVEANDLVEGVFRDLGHERTSYGHWKHSFRRYNLHF